jgi:hypothetical protein
MQAIYPMPYIMEPFVSNKNSVNYLSKSNTLAAQAGRYLLYRNVDIANVQ